MKKALTSGNKVLVINDKFLLMQGKKEDFWDVTVLMKNSSHLMFCTLMEAEDIEIPKSIKVSEIKKPMGKAFAVSGTQEEMGKFARALVDQSNKLCMAIPFRSSTSKKAKTAWYKFW